MVASVLFEAGAIVRDDAGINATANIANIGSAWSRFKSGRRTTMVYVASSAKSSGGSPRPNLSPLLFNEALLPAARANEERTVESVKHALDILCLRVSTV